MNNKMISAGVSFLLILSTAAQAETWQVGILAESSQSPFTGDSRETSSLPMINYLGDRFSFIGGNVEYRLNSADASEIYMVAQPRSRQYYSASPDSSDDVNIEGMNDRDPAFEMGLGIKNQTASGQYLLQGVFDVTGTHEGYELTAKYSYPKQIGSWLLEPAISLQLQSSELVDYYHGVTISETTQNRPAYQGSQAINTLTSVMVGYTINAQLLAIASLEQILLDESIAESPIVSRNQVRKLYLGVIYTF